MDDRLSFQLDCNREINEQGLDRNLRDASLKWVEASSRYKYSYHFEWLGVPIIQYPQDMIAIQNLIYKVKPDLIIETGIARGGSLIFYASILELLSLSDKKLQNSMVLGIDIDIREHNKRVILNHPMARRIKMIEGSSTSIDIFNQVESFSRDFNKILVILDSNHTHDHVLEELNLFAPLVSPSSYCIVLDTIIEDMPQDIYDKRPWSKGNNPKTAVYAYLNKLKNEYICGQDNERLQLSIDYDVENTILISVAPDGYLKRI